MFKNYFIRNLAKICHIIQLMLSAAESDVAALDDDMDDIRDVFLNGNVSILVVDDTLYDSNNNPIQDNDGNSFIANIIYHKQT